MHKTIESSVPRLFRSVYLLSKHHTIANKPPPTTTRHYTLLLYCNVIQKYHYLSTENDYTFVILDFQHS